MTLFPLTTALSALLSADPAQNPDTTLIHIVGLSPNSETQVGVRGLTARGTAKALTWSDTLLVITTPAELAIPPGPVDLRLEALSGTPAFHVTSPPTDKIRSFDVWGRSVSIRRAAGDSSLTFAGGTQ